MSNLFFSIVVKKLIMLKCPAFSLCHIGAKLKPRVNCLENLRWATGIAAEKIYYDDASLKAAKPFEDLPSMTTLPIIGTAWVFLPIIGRYDLKDFMASLLDKRKLFGNIYRDKLGPSSFVVSFNAEDLQTMYKHEGPYPERIELETVKTYRELRKNWYTTLGITLLNGKEWHDMRRMTQKHLMKPKAVQAFLNPMQDISREFVDKIFEERDANKEMPDLLGELYKWALESVALVGLDSRLGCLKKNLPPDSDGMKMIKCIQALFDCILNLETFFGNLPLWKYFPTPTWKKFIEASDIFTETAFKHINRSLEKLKSATEEDQDLTLLQSLLLTEGMDVSSAMVMVGDMLLAGIEATSHTIGFFLYHMAKNPDKQELLYQHIKRTLPQKEDRITPTSFNELKYLKACIKESQRVQPVVGAQVRTADHDVVLSGYRIPAKTVLLVAIEGIFKDKRYFTNPNEFLPERWLNKDEKFHPFAFIPFGVGTRSCIGRRLAEQKIICLIAEIIRNFKVEYHHEDIGRFTRLLNVPDKPLRFNFIER